MLWKRIRFHFLQLHQPLMTQVTMTYYAVHKMFKARRGSRCLEQASEEFDGCQGTAPWWSSFNWGVFSESWSFPTCEWGATTTKNSGFPSFQTTLQRTTFKNSFDSKNNPNKSPKLENSQQFSTCSLQVFGLKGEAAPARDTQPRLKCFNAKRTCK